MKRFYIQPTEKEENQVLLRGAEARHLVTVLRYSIGREIELFDGTGRVFRAVIRNIHNKEVSLEIVSEYFFRDTAPHVSVGQALLKGTKMDFLIQKATELGIHAIHPFISDYCANRWHAKKIQRWQKITLEACKQCGRPRPLICHPMQTFSAMLNTADSHETKLIFWENESVSLTEKLSPGKESVFMLVGPEGGFSEKEIEEARDQGFQPVSLGRRILRAETAAFCAMSIVQYVTGNLDNR